MKGNIGHTKAAAGVGGLIKAILAVHHQIIPPATSHIDPHPALLADRPALRVPAAPHLWPQDQPVRAGVSSMGFGGINAHVVIEQAVRDRRTDLGSDVHRLVSSRQDCELLLIDAESTADLRGQAAALSAMCARLSFAELADLSASLESQLADRPIRAAVLAANPEEAEEGFSKLLVLLDNGARSALDPQGNVFLGNAAASRGSVSCSPARAPVGEATAVPSGAGSRQWTSSTSVSNCPPTATWSTPPSRSPGS